MAGIFKAYDIRGIYGETLDEEMAFKIGRAFATFLKCKKVVVGHDMRPHSKPLFEALARGLNLQGADVIDIGMCTTPMSYFANGSLNADAGIIITASHNTGEWNGLKLCRKQAIPISGETGIMDVERIVNEEAFDAPAAQPGVVTEHAILEEYVASIRKHAKLERPITIAADMANSMGILESEVLKGLVTLDPMFDTYDGTFPNHEANPLKVETFEDLQEKVRAGSYDFGIAFDGDADRVGFVDELGNVIPMDIITALIAEDILADEKGVIFYDLRSSWAVKEVIESNGGTAMMSRVGHSFIKQQMREANAIFAGELSGHYYFRDNFFTESSSLAVLCVANIVSASDKPLSELIKPIQRYFASGEINSEVKDAAAVLALIKAKYSDGRMFELDGISVEYDDWWLNVRTSNTEPLVRLNVEAKTEALMTEKRDELLAAIRS
ncbi:MAG: phosphomannomutase/phosphoglucomutase [Verrucomicrobia bacterium]|jgi:phosphomannomutase|nr:phosphomannomutase/phosphoglucomutase [Verrucomicrobiota bacterium]